MKKLILLFIFVSLLASDVDLVVFSYDRPMQLLSFLESTFKHVKGLGQVTVIYRTSNDEFGKGYDIVKAKFTSVNYVHQGDNAHQLFKSQLIDAVFSGKSEYISFAVDDIIVLSAINMSYCVDVLEKQGAYGFYLRMGRNITECYSAKQDITVPTLRHAQDDVYAWIFVHSNGDWSVANTVDMAIHRKKDVKEFMETALYKTPNEFETLWIHLVDSKGKEGLCFEQSKHVNLPLNIVQECQVDRSVRVLSTEELLEELLSGFKIDINSFEGMVPSAPHMDWIPDFIPLDNTATTSSQSSF